MKKITKIPSYFSRLFYQLKPMLKTLSFKHKVLYLLHCIKNFKEVFLSGRLLEPDKYISKHLITLKFDDNIIIPFKKIEEILCEADANDHCSLELTREIFLNNEYLRHFKKSFHPQIIIDIGANRGFFSLLAMKKYCPQKLIKIEPQDYTKKIFEIIANCNELKKAAIAEHYSFCQAAATAKKNTISINEILEKERITKIDLIKIDIEGGEVDIFSENLQWLEKCHNITMELHFFDKDTSFIPSMLTKLGFCVKATNLEGIEKPLNILKKDPRRCCYLYASREGQLN